MFHYGDVVCNVKPSVSLYSEHNILPETTHLPCHFKWTTMSGLPLYSTLFIFRQSDDSPQCRPKVSGIYQRSSLVFTTLFVGFFMLFFFKKLYPTLKQISRRCTRFAFYTNTCQVFRLKANHLNPFNTEEPSIQPLGFGIWPCDLCCMHSPFLSPSLFYHCQ